MFKALAVRHQSIVRLLFPFSLIMSDVDYNHEQNLHTGEAAQVIVPIVLARINPSSVLDVGCGKGDWIREFKRHGVMDCMGIDGIGLEGREYHADPTQFKKINLTEEWNLDRRFDLAVCLEVAEHIPEHASNVLLENIARHASTILFSAAIPFQPGQGHVNCHPPEYWQLKLNRLGYSCIDPWRERFWNKEFSEYWYKQNLFLAEYSLVNAGAEPRIRHLIHPDMLKDLSSSYSHDLTRLKTENQHIRTLLRGGAGFGQALRSSASMIYRSIYAKESGKS